MIASLCLPASVFGMSHSVVGSLYHLHIGCYSFRESIALPMPPAKNTSASETVCLSLTLNLLSHTCVSIQTSRAGSVSAKEQEAEGKTPPVSVPGPDVLGEPGRPTGHRQTDRCY